MSLNNKKQSNPTISIIIPVYNVENYLEQCLESVVNQTLENIEIICVDDCSSDTSPEILRKWSKKHSKVRCIFHKNNCAAAQSRKDGILASTGEYIMFVDADDFLEPNACEAACEAIKKTGSDMLHFGTIIENCGNLPEARIKANQKMVAPNTAGEIRGNLLEACIVKRRFSFNLWDKIYRGDLWREAIETTEDGVFPKANDLYGMLHFLHRAKTYTAIEKPLYHYCFGRGMTGHNVMSLDSYALCCKSSLVYHAFERYLNRCGERKQYSELFGVLKKRLLDEQFGKWINNVDARDQGQALQILCQEWGTLEIISILAKRMWYQRAIIAELVKDFPMFTYRPRPIKTVALHYRCISNGGAQRVVAQLANLFAQKQQNGVGKYRIVLFTEAEIDDQTEEYALDASVTRIILPERMHNGRDNFEERARILWDAIDEYQIDVFSSSMWVDAATFWDMLIIKSHYARPAFIMHTHNVCALPWRWDNEAVKEMWNSYSMADAVVTLSSVDRMYWHNVNARTYFCCNPSWYHTADIRRTTGPGNYILWLGRISAEKQPLEMVRIMKRVVEDIPDAICHMVGSGDKKIEEGLRSAIENEGLSKNFIMEGFRVDVDQFYQQADVLMTTSEYEGFTLTLYESAAFGVPSVTYDLPWLEYYRILKGWDTVSQKNDHQAASRIVRLLSDREYWQKQSDAAYASYQAYENLDIEEDWARIFRDLELNTAPEDMEPNPQIKILLERLQCFHGSLASRTRSLNSDLNAKLENTYVEKSELNAKLEKTYVEKSELNAKLQKTYKEKSERGQIIKEQKSKLDTLNKLYYVRFMKWLKRVRPGSKTNS